MSSSNSSNNTSSRVGPSDTVEGLNADDGFDASDRVGLASKCDGRVEVLGVRMIHLATSQVPSGLASGIKLAQARSVTVRLLGKRPVPMQVDGEPQLLRQPATVRLWGAPAGTAVVLQVGWWWWWC
jgi:hypothetical protein